MLVRRKRFADVEISARGEPFLHLGLAPCGGEHDDLDVPPLGSLADALAHLVPALHRHHHVEQHEVGFIRIDEFQHCVAVSRDEHLVAAAPEQELERGDDVRLVIGNEHLLFPRGHAAAAPRSRGKVKEKQAPRPGSLSTQSFPPWCSTMCRLIGRPRPVPGGRSVSVSPAWRNLSKMIAWSSALTPGPLSRTSTRTLSAPTASATSMRPLPGSQNFTALDSRFSSTWMRRSTSPGTCGADAGSLASTRMPFSSNTWPIPAMESEITSFMSTCESCHSARPDSIFERSSTWLMSRVKRSVSLVMMSRNRLRCESSTFGSWRRISEKARIEVRGVRSSCVTTETKSSFMRSSSFRRSFASRSSAVAASSSRDFCSRRWL